MAIDEVKLLGSWSSPFSRRVEIALKLKGISYDFADEYLPKKSPLLLETNPVYKKIPVLIHNGKPIVESAVILEYIDETWDSNPKLMPTDPYERAEARFWRKFIDEKIKLRSLLIGNEEERQIAEGEACEVLKVLENELKVKGKKFFGGDEIGMVDIVGINVALYVPAFQEADGKQLFTRESFPLLSNWADALLSSTIVEQILPSKESLVTRYRSRISTRALPKAA